MRCASWALLCAAFGVMPAALAEAPAEWTSPMALRAGEAVEHPTVPVFRGEPSLPWAPEPVRPAPAWWIDAGEKLWLVDPETGRVIACRERGTFTVGRRAIQCSERRLQALRG